MGLGSVIKDKVNPWRRVSTMVREDVYLKLQAWAEEKEVTVQEVFAAWVMMVCGIPDKDKEYLPNELKMGEKGK